MRRDCILERNQNQSQESESESDPHAFAAAAASSAPATLSQVTEGARIQEAGHLRCRFSFSVALSLSSDITNCGFNPALQ